MSCLQLGELAVAGLERLVDVRRLVAERSTAKFRTIGAGKLRRLIVTGGGRTLLCWFVAQGWGEYRSKISRHGWLIASDCWYGLANAGMDTGLEDG